MKHNLFVDLLYLALRHRFFIVINVAVVTIAALMISLQLPKWYASSASLKLSSQTEVNIGSLLGGLREVPGVELLGLNSLSSSLDAYVALLSSRSVIDSMITRFDLMQKYKTKYRFQCRKKFLANTSYRIDRSSEVLTISILDEDPAMAKDMLDYYLLLLDEFSRQITNQDARNNRLFVEKRYLQNLSDLHQAEDSLRIFQEKNQVYLPEEQTMLALRAATELQAELNAGEMEMAIAGRIYKDNSVELEKTRLKVEQLRRRLHEMKEGYKTGNGIAGNETLFTPFRKAPEIAMQYVRLYREVEIQDKLLAFLLPMYEKAKIDENRDTPSIIVIDHPDMPEYKAKPKRAVIVIAAFLFSLGFSFAYLLLRNYLRNFSANADPDLRERLNYIRSNLRFRKSRP